MITTTYEVEKFIRGNQGEWHGLGAKRFQVYDDAFAYLEAFASEQRTDNGLRIDMRSRSGRSTKLVATVGGRLNDAATIRVLD